MLVDDHKIVLDGLREVLEQSGEFDVVGQAGDGADAVRAAQQLKPDVIIMDVIMPVKNGIDACREISEILPDTKVLVLTASTEDDAVMEAVAAGATGYLQKFHGKDKLLQTVRGRCRRGVPYTCRGDEACVRRNAPCRGTAKDVGTRPADCQRAGDSHPLRAGAVIFGNSRGREEISQSPSATPSMVSRTNWG